MGAADIAEAAAAGTAAATVAGTRRRGRRRGGGHQRNGRRKAPVQLVGFGRDGGRWKEMKGGEMID